MEGGAASKTTHAFMTVGEFADELGVCIEKARQICAGADHPPMVTVGCQRRVIRSLLDGWYVRLAEKGAVL